jgi:hypothetical protein
MGHFHAYIMYVGSRRGVEVEPGVWKVGTITTPWPNQDDNYVLINVPGHDVPIMARYMDTKREDFVK